MLVVTMAILGGLSAVSIASLRSANAALVTDSQEAVSDTGLLLTVAATQANSTGSYLWLFNYGWVAGRLTSVYLNGGLLGGWLSTCTPLQARSICSLSLPPDTHGGLTIFFGHRSISVTL
jgi:hypothetical protein